MTVEIEVRVLYQRLLDAWNARSAQDFAALFAEDGSLIGYDGSQLNGRVEIEASLGRIFKDHLTASYINIVREVRSLSADVVLLRAVAGMVPHGKTDLNPEVNAIQSLVAQKRGGGWQIALFQNTPAQFHGRPDLARELTDELGGIL
jgi:uncharacterized protein (TIGR02246 family)